MDKYREHIFNAITGETKTIERDFTQEEIAEKSRLAKEQQIQLIETELAELDVIVPRVIEDIVAQGGFTLHPTKQAVIDRKNVLRQQLRDLQ